eukprot:CAMPEP_0197698266 /NCGR_PEP_ID=MMETSP1338-20131121/119079_1 /TAXON_ID=43686 ORGANISM="Pelagodinium beii, Strain RCC1491" /NCGR_SAMPLE_ID=MMETSP1338 /ASSEMBLY_ACC=CAM_ASM_000754 /LENGTH=97 /DNA_ID=CAMNT_0043281621 /DNA_START=814 /DNA_END=1107 /DNA_ORIENTATION=-
MAEDELRVAAICGQPLHKTPILLKCWCWKPRRLQRAALVQLSLTLSSARAAMTEKPASRPDHPAPAPTLMLLLRFVSVSVFGQAEQKLQLTGAGSAQ